MFCPGPRSFLQSFMAAPAPSSATATWWTMLRERVLEFIHPTATVVIGDKKIKVHLNDCDLSDEQMDELMMISVFSEKVYYYIIYI